MARYRYAGTDPVEDDGVIVRPGDERDTEPPWGPWELLPEPEGAESSAEPPATPVPAPEADRPPAASTEPPAATSGPDPEPETDTKPAKGA